MPDPHETESLERLKQTMALDLSIAMRHQMPPRACVEFLMRIPEFAQAMHLRIRGKRDIDIDTPEGVAIAVERLEWVAAFLDDGFNGACVARIREVIGDLTECG